MSSRVLRVQCSMSARIGTGSGLTAAKPARFQSRVAAVSEPPRPPIDRRGRDRYDWRQPDAREMTEKQDEQAAAERAKRRQRQKRIDRILIYGGAAATIALIASILLFGDPSQDAASSTSTTEPMTPLVTTTTSARTTTSATSTTIAPTTSHAHPKNTFVTTTGPTTTTTSPFQDLLEELGIGIGPIPPVPRSRFNANQYGCHSDGRCLDDWDTWCDEGDWVYHDEEGSYMCLETAEDW
jgi:hypothetical protein